MALARARRNESAFNYWPGFVDALSTLVLSIVFLLSVFLVVQFFLSQEVTGKDKALEQLNAKIAQLNDLLSLEKLAKLNLDDQVSQLRAGLASAEGERDRIKGLYDGLAGAGDAQGRANELNKALDSEKQVTSRALAQIEVLNQQISALRRQLVRRQRRRDVAAPPTSRPGRAYGLCLSPVAVHRALPEHRRPGGDPGAGPVVLLAGSRPARPGRRRPDGAGLLPDVRLLGRGATGAGGRRRPGLLRGTAHDFPRGSRRSALPRHQ